MYNVTFARFQKWNARISNIRFMQNLLFSLIYQKQRLQFTRKRISLKSQYVKANL